MERQNPERRMEKELETSLYNIWAMPDVRRAAALDVQWSEDMPRFALPEARSSYITQIASKVYGMLDTLLGVRSYIFSEGRGHQVRAYTALFELFLKAGYISSYALRSHRYNDAPRFFRSSAEFNYPEGITDGRMPKSKSAGGFGKDELITISKGLGELCERYLLTVYRRSWFQYASPATLAQGGKTFVHPDAFSGFSTAQKEWFSQRVYTDESVFAWVSVRRVRSGNRALIPAQFIFWNYLLASGEPFLRETNTNGGGAHFSREGAVLSGLYELIQRDSFLMYWLLRVPPVKIRPETVPDERFQKLHAESERYGFIVHALDITLDTDVPAFAVFLEDPTDGFPAISVGGGCGADPQDALYTAFEEAWAIYYGSRTTAARHKEEGKVPYTLPELYKPFFTDAVYLHDRLELSANHQYRERFSHFLSGNTQSFADRTYTYPAVFSGVHAELDALVSRVEALGAGYEVYAHLVEHPLLKQMAYHVARVVVPQFMPLHLTECNIALGAEARFRKAAGFLGIAYDPAAIETFPHPFP